jgi:hypothetical protein
VYEWVASKGKEKLKEGRRLFLKWVSRSKRNIKEKEK